MNQLLEQIKFNNGIYPRDELNEIIRNKEEYIPDLLATLKDIAEHPVRCLPDTVMLHIYVPYLLAQLRVHEAFPLMLKIMRLPEKIIDQLFGDVFTEDFGRMAASVYDGDIKLLQELIEDSLVSDLARGMGLETLRILFLKGIIDRAFFSGYLLSLLRDKKYREESEFISDIVYTLSVSAITEAYKDVKWAFEQKLVDELMIGLDDFENDMNEGEQLVDTERNSRVAQYIDDIHKELSMWDSFGYAKPQPFINNDKIGPNDPCPCGSGKKYKKCCM